MMSTSPRRRSEKAEAGYLITTVDQPRSSVVEERPTRVPVFKVDVVAATFTFGAILFAALFSVYAGFWPGGVTGILTLLFFLWRVGRIFDVPLSDIKETIFQDVRVEQQEQRTIPVSSGGAYQGEVQLRGAKTVRGSLGNVQLSGRQLDALVSIINDPNGDGKLRRETSGLGKGVQDIGITTAQFPVFSAALKENGYIDDDSNFTADGIEWVTRP